MPLRQSKGSNYNLVINVVSGLPQHKSENIMHEVAARVLTLAHETFRCGVPHFRERRLIPIRTSAHLIVFDAEKISPLYTMLEVDPTEARKAKEIKVERIDNFSSGDVSLPDELSTTEQHYANWNKAQKRKPVKDQFLVDKGHSAGSQYRRDDVVEQSDVDTCGRRHTRSLQDEQEL